ncbi:MAG: aspartate kinase [Bacteroidota bacterium]
MLVFKFGGASVKSAEAVKNMAGILSRFREPVVVVVSAMGKTTNALERVVEWYVSRDEKKLSDEFAQVKDYHLQIMSGLFPDIHSAACDRVHSLFAELSERLKRTPALNYDFDYDQIVSYGELISTAIIAGYLKEVEQLPCRWIDVREAIKTDNNYREGRVDWQLTSRLVPELFKFAPDRLLITQGFLGSTENNLTTTLGREGSDYTAAILAYALHAESVTIWKDVPGVLNADPKWFDDTVLLEQLSYLDAIELAYYGASVIHPKTIQPLQNRDIRLYVRSFLNPEAPGTMIGNLSYEKLVPSFIFKMNQVLLRISPHDFSFIAEHNLELIFRIINKHGARINLMQNSAVSFQVCTGFDPRKTEPLVKELSEHFKVMREDNLELITIRYFDESTIARVMQNKELILEHRGTQNIQLVVRDLG